MERSMPSKMSDDKRNEKRVAVYDGFSMQGVTHA
jgi:hypothetical protein